MLAAEATREEMKRYIHVFGIKGYKLPKPIANAEELAALQTDQLRREEKRIAVRQAKLEADCQEQHAENLVWLETHPEYRQRFTDGEHIEVLRGEHIRAEERIRYAGDRDEWLQGKGSNRYTTWSYAFPTDLRVVGDTVETSRGAVFPVAHAKRGLALVEAVRRLGAEWHSNGHSFHLGPYAINRITPAGTVFAGCHVVSWEAIERIKPELERVAE